MVPISGLLRPLPLVRLLLLLGLSCHFGMAQTIDMPPRNNSPGFEVSYTTCEATLYDSGGLTDVYGNNENGIVTFCPATAGDRIRIRFTMANIKANDSLKVYDGASDNAPLLLTITNTFSLDEPQEASASQGNPEGCLTVTFRSQNLSFANVYDGWVARVSCFTPQIEPGVPVDLFRNDDPSGDGIELFDLRENDLPVLNGLSEPEYQVNYFASESDAENNINPLNPLHTNAGNPQTIYTRLQGTTTDYFAVNSFEIFVNPIPEIVPVPDLISCGENGLTPFYLADRFPDIYNGREGLLAVFYESPEALSANADPIDPESEYLNLANPQTIYYRLIDTSTGAYGIGDFLIRTQPVPAVSTPAPIPVCGDGEGEGMINLFGINPEILGGQTGLDITYHVSISEAEEGLNPLAAELTIRSDLEVYARVTDPQNGCASIVPVSLEFQSAPETILREVYLLCPSPEDNQLPALVVIDTGLDPSAYEFSWFRDGVLLPGENGAAITMGIPGSYEVSLTQNDEGCSFSFSAEARLAEPPTTLDISFNPQELANSYQVQVNTQGDLPYLFRLDGGVSDASGVFQDILPGAHLLTITTEDGCEVLTREFEIFGYPVFFTPNGDGINDRWSLLGAEGLEVNSVSIFDRFGRLLYVMEGSGPGWDGTSNGRQMPASSYWFMVEYKSGDSLLTSSGYFALKR